MLTTFVPAILPIARDPVPAWIASIPTASSGADVPMDTTVSPMTMGGMPRRDAIFEPERTTSSAPPIRAVRPMSRLRIGAIMVSSLLGSRDVGRRVRRTFSGVLGFEQSAQIRDLRAQGLDLGPGGVFGGRRGPVGLRGHAFDDPR